MALLRSKTIGIAGAGAAVAVLALFAYAHYMDSPAMPQHISQVTIHGEVVNVEVADTDAAREQGLSGRASLAEGSGMLFVFDSPQEAGFWMKDMHFDLDMLFIDSYGKIVTIYSNVRADSYLKNPPDVFYPKAPAKYVLEVPAGFAATHGVAEGQQMIFQ